MAKKYFNWTLAIVLLIALVVLVVSAFSFRKWQRNRMGSIALETGIKAYKNHNWQEAAKNLGSYLMINQGDAQILLKYAEAQLNIRPLKLDNVKQAERTYRNVLRLDKNNTAAAEELLNLYLKMDIPAEAELISQRYLKTNKNPKIRRMLAISLAQQRKFREAAIQLTQTIEEHPEQIPAYEAMGQITEHSPDNFSQTPEYWFNKAVNNNPSSPAFISRASFYLRNNNSEKALSDLAQAEKLDLSEPEIRLRLAREFVNADMFDKARTHLEKVQSQNPTIQQLWQIRATLALRTKSKQEMLKTAQAGLKELESQPWGFMPVAVELFIRCGEFDHAREYIKKLKQKTIAPARVAFLQGLLAEAQKQYHKAIQHWQQARQLGDKSAETLLALASTYYHTGDTQTAILQLRILVSEYPYSFQGHLDLAKLLIEIGNPTEAAEHAYLAMQIDPGNTDAALLHTQARIRLIELNQPAAKPDRIWKNIEKQLAELKSITGSTPQVELLQCRLAIQRGQFAKAEEILKNLKTNESLQIEAAIAEVDLLIAQDKTEQAVSTLYSLTKQFPDSILPLKYLSVLSETPDDRGNCEKLLKDALENSEDPIAKRDLALLTAQFYDQAGQKNKSCEILTKLSDELAYDITLKRRLLQYGQVIADTNKAQQLVNQTKTIEGKDGWQWKYEQAKLWFGGETFQNRYPQIITLLKENLTDNPENQTSRILLAAAYDKAGELQLAISTYREILNSSQADIHVIISAVAVLNKARQYQEAEEILKQAAMQNPLHPELSKLKLQEHLRDGNLKSAESILEELIAEDPDDKTMPLVLALMKMRQNKYSQAAELLSKLKTQQPNSLPVSAALVELNIYQNKNEKALALCDEIIQQPGNASAYILRGKTYAVLGQYDQAEKDFEQAINLEPDNTQAWVLKSNLNQSMRQSEAAIADIKKALELDPNNIKIQKHAIGLLLSSNETQKIHQGRKLLDRALSLHPKDTQLRLYKAKTLMTEETLPSAEQAQLILQKITEGQPQTARAWAMLAQSYLKDAQPGKAMGVVLQGLTFLQNDKTLLSLKAQAEAATSPALAIPTLKMLHELAPNDVDIVLQLADTHIAAGETDKAAKLYSQILDIEPDNIFAINNLAWTICEEQGQYHQALELAEKGLKSAPDYANLIDTRGVIYYRLGKYNLAVHDFARCLKLYPKNSSYLAASHFHLAKALIALGQSSEAIDNLQKTLTLNSKAGGLSPAEINKAEHLLTKLLQDKNHAYITNQKK